MIKGTATYSRPFVLERQKKYLPSGPWCPVSDVDAVIGIPALQRIHLLVIQTSESITECTVQAFTCPRSLLADILMQRIQLVQRPVFILCRSWQRAERTQADKVVQYSVPVSIIIYTFGKVTDPGYCLVTRYNVFMRGAKGQDFDFQSVKREGREKRFTVICQCHPVDSHLIQQLLRSYF